MSWVFPGLNITDLIPELVTEATEAMEQGTSVMLRNLRRRVG